MSIKFEFKGFDDILKDIEDAGRTAESAVDSVMRESAQIMHNELKNQMRESNVPERLISAMPPPEIETNGNITYARVGYRKGNYDPKDPSDGYLIVFLNYGTPDRQTHGKMVGRGFIRAAKETAKKKIEKQQNETLKKILSRLKK